MVLSGKNHHQSPVLWVSRKISVSTGGFSICQWMIWRMPLDMPPKLRFRAGGFGPKNGEIDMD
jgi:hypothetical protein